MIKLLSYVVVFGGLVSQAAAGPLHNAARDGDVELVKSLIADGEDVNERDRNLGWPLHQAALNDHVEVAELLLEAGADVTVDHRIFGVPLLAAAQKGSVSVAALLLEAGAEPDVRTDNGSTPLHIAASGGYADLVELLVANGADINARTTRPNAVDYAPIHSAGLNGHFDVVALLRSLGAMGAPVEPIAELIATADKEAGRVAFGEGARGDPTRCGGCHSVSGSDIERKRGPNLQGVVGRDKASVEGYDYEFSEALVRLGGVWTVAELNAFIARPLDYAPGSTMEFWGVSDPAERANIIAYLTTASE